MFNFYRRVLWIQFYPSTDVPFRPSVTQISYDQFIAFSDHFVLDLSLGAFSDLILDAFLGSKLTFLKFSENLLIKYLWNCAW